MLHFSFSKRQEGLIKGYEKKQETHRETLSKLQQQFQQSQVFVYNSLDEMIGNEKNFTESCLYISLYSKLTQLSCI